MAYAKKINLFNDATLSELPDSVKSYLNTTYNSKGVNYNKIILYVGEEIVEKSYKNPSFNTLINNEIYVYSLEELINFTPLL
jgi:hypothetical protein